MITAVHIEHFKCLEAFTLTLGRLTLLTGYNAAGKSSSIQPLLLLSQVLREPPLATVLPLNGPLVRLGSAGDVASIGSEGGMRLGVSGSDGTSASWSFRQDRALARHELRLTNSRFSSDDDQAARWQPTNPGNGLLDRIRSLIFLGAVRDPLGEAQPYPDNPSATVGDVGIDGRFAAYWLVRQADDEVPEARRHPEDSRVTVRAQVDAWLNELFPGANVSAEEIGGLALAKTKFRLGRSSDWRRPANVGYGLSYAFPILVALICAKPGQLFIVDSPEAHLHPRAQSAMGQILARFAAAGVQLIVESHSDHLLAGIRLAVRRALLPASEVAIHFFAGADPGGDGHERIEMADDGGVTHWPTGFFDQAINDLVELS